MTFLVPRPDPPNFLQTQAMLGHADPSTTAQYIGAYERDEDAAVDYVKY